MKARLGLLGAPTALLARRRAVAQSRRKVDCTTELTQSAVKTKARRQSRLDARQATVCVMALTADDARQ